MLDVFVQVEKKVHKSAESSYLREPSQAG